MPSGAAAFAASMVLSTIERSEYLDKWRQEQRMSRTRWARRSPQKASLPKHNLMTRTKFFIISSVIIFVLERVLSAVVPWPVFIFPVFTILFGLSIAGDILAYLPHIAIAALFFDFFSGLPFGWFTIAILVVFLTIYLARNFLSVGGESLIFALVFSLIFIFEHFFLLSIKTSPRLVISQAPLILFESVILLIFMRVIFRKVINRPSSNFAK